MYSLRRIWETLSWSVALVPDCKNGPKVHLLMELEEAFETRLPFRSERSLTRNSSRVGPPCPSGSLEGMKWSAANVNGRRQLVSALFQSGFSCIKSRYWSLETMTPPSTLAYQTMKRSTTSKCLSLSGGRRALHALKLQLVTSISWVLWRKRGY